jgi:hypothetical protein
MQRHLRIASLVLLAALIVPSLHARVLRLEITSRTDVLNGKQFGDAGSYERITGRVYFSLSVANPHNQRIVDLSNAVNLKDGEVEFSSDFIAVRPKDPQKGNGSMILEVPNRGHARFLSLVDGGDLDLAHDAGDAWLLRNGFTIVSLGWQWDADGPDALRLYAPIAKDHGNTISGLLRGDLMLAKTLLEIPLGHLFSAGIGGTEYAVADPNDPRNVLTVRTSREADRTVIPRTEWQFAHTVDGKLTPSNRHIHLTGGFQPGKIYEYVYAVADPVVAGGGFAVVRDFASYAKHNPDSIAPAARVYGEGISQNGRFLRDSLYQGFNTDEEGRIALDGVLAHVAGAGRGSFNYRFAQPSRDAQPTSSIFFPTDIFPFTDLPEKDPVTGDAGGLLDRATAEKVVPKIFFSNTSATNTGAAPAPDPCQCRRQTRRANLRQRPHLSLHRAAAFLRPVPTGKRKGRSIGTAAAVPAAGQIFLARHDRQHGCMGAQQHPSAAEQLSQDRRRNSRAASRIRVARHPCSEPPARSQRSLPARFRTVPAKESSAFSRRRLTRFRRARAPGRRRRQRNRWSALAAGHGSASERMPVESSHPSIGAPDQRLPSRLPISHFQRPPPTVKRLPIL